MTEGSTTIYISATYKFSFVTVISENRLFGGFRKKCKIFWIFQLIEKPRYDEVGIDLPNLSAKTWQSI